MFRYLFERTLVLLVCLIGAPAFGAGIFVSAAASSPGTGTAATPFKYLQSALAIATSGDTVYLTQGNYYPDQTTGGDSDDVTAKFVVPAGVTILGGWDGEIPIGDDAPEVCTSDDTVLNGQISATLQSHVVAELAPHSTNVTGLVTTLRCVRITNAATDLSISTKSAALRAVAPSLLVTLDTVQIQANRTKSIAAGAYLEVAGLNMQKSDVLDNALLFEGLFPEGHVAGVYVVVPSPGSVIVNNCRFKGNQGSAGGGLRIEAATSVVRNSYFYANRVQSDFSTLEGRGGALRLDPCGNGCTSNAQVSRCAFVSGGLAAQTGGGAVFANTSTFRIWHSLFSGNLVKSHGGAIFTSSGTSELFNCQFEGNITSANEFFHGGAVYFLGGTSTVTNCSFLENRASGLGGAIYGSSTGSIEIKNSVFQASVDRNNPNSYSKDFFFESGFSWCVNNSRFDAFNSGGLDEFDPASSSCSLTGNISVSAGSYSDSILTQSIFAGEFIGLKSPPLSSPIRNAGNNSFLPSADFLDADNDANTAEAVSVDLNVIFSSGANIPSRRVFGSAVDMGAIEIPCAGADFNQDGSTNVGDIFAFLAAWFAGCTAPGAVPCYASADFDNSGMINVADIFAFLSSWFSTSPGVCQ